jgi:hypothetical protein
MDNTNKQIKNISIGIPTCYGGETLVKTAESIYESVEYLKSQKPYVRVQFLVAADRTPLSPEVLSRLEKLGVDVTWNEKEGSQLKKLEQTIKKADGDIFVSTQDDVRFDRETLFRIVENFEADEELTMLGVRVLPIRGGTFFESILSTMVRVVDTIGRNWNKGDNHLMASGRCLAYRGDFIKRFRKPHEVINCDMFFYLENKRLGGKFAISKRAKVYIRTPKTIKEQTGASSRYQYSQQELTGYFDTDISKEYFIPLGPILTGLMGEFIRNPFAVLGYLGVYVYTRIKKQKKKQVANTNWEVDSSTK